MHNELNEPLVQSEDSPRATAPMPGVGRSEPVKVDPPVVAEEPVAAKPDPARVDEIHTPENTTMGRQLPESGIFKSVLDPKSKEDGYLTVFLGNTKRIVEANNDLVQHWLIYTANLGMHRKREITETQLQSAKANWLDYLATNHPGSEPEDMEKYAYELYDFMDNLRDGVKIRSRIMHQDATNMSDRGSGFTSPDVFGKRPSVKSNGLTLSEQMRRSSLNANQDLYEFDILLRNTFMSLTIRRPNLLSLGSLVLDISNTVKGYVRKVNNPSVTLAYLASVRALWHYMSKLILLSSVKNTRDFTDLADSILLTDVDQLAIGLVEATNTRGVNLELRCLYPECDWSEFGLADATKLIHNRRHLETPAESAIYANVFNRRQKYGRNEMEEFQRAAATGLEDNKVFGDDNREYFVIAPPTLTQAFESLDYFVNTINPRIQEIRSNAVNERAYEEELTTLLTSLSSAEYVHWIAEYGILPTPGSDEEPIVYKRPKTDTDEFTKGLLQILDDNPSMGAKLVKFVYNKTPFMSRTFTGVANHECPKCRKASQGADHRNIGYTPINALMSFFTLSQLSLMRRVAQADQVNQEALSD